MLTNYLKIALRNIKKHLGYSFINITGLAIGMACTILILLWVKDELSFDKFHENADDIYRVIQDIQFTEYNTIWAITQGPLGPSLKTDFSEIVNSARVMNRGFRFKYGEKSFDERVGFADASIFEMFTFPLIKGDPATALTEPFSIVVTKEMAEKYFGDEEPIGKTLKADNQFDFKVTGILEEIPKNSHLQFDFIVPFIFGRELDYSVDRWNNSGFTTYVMLQKGTPAQEVIHKIADYLKEKPTLEENAKLNLQPLSRIHLYSNYDFDGYGNGDIKYVTIFSVVACFILLIACINFMNLTTACASNRAKEVGMRKVAGAYKFDLVKQFFGESILLTSISLLCAILLVELLLPAFNRLSGKELVTDYFGNYLMLSGLVGIAFITGIISGTYPALFLSSFQPVKVLKSTLTSKGGSSWFRKILVVTQFALSIILIIGSIVVFNQLNFMRNKKLGYDKEHIVTMRLRGDMRQKYEIIKSELMQNPNILNVTATTNLPTYGYSFSNSLWRWEGQNPDDETLMRAVFVDYDYFETFGMEMVEGRSYSKDFATDTSDAIIVNEEAVKAMGMESPIGKRLGRDDYYPSIIGVVKNYHFRSLRTNIEPLILLLVPQYCRSLCVRISSENISGTIEFLESKYKKFVPEFPFNYSFLDERVDNMYRAEKQISTIFSYFTFLAIFISCLGLFGLATFMSEQRTKEIGVRKVLGASISGIVLLLSKQFTKWVLAANIIAWPIAYLAMNNWLQDFAYRINIGWWTFALAGALALIIALLTVSYQAIKAALTNPADALRYE